MIKAVYKSIVPEKMRNDVHIYYRKLKSLFLKGENFYCPCCERSSSKFLDKGNGLVVRKNAVCPNCGSLERSRLLKLYLENETKIFENNPKILHFAPEESLKNLLKLNPNYVDVDINPNLASIEMDITEITFPNDHFDLIICSHVLGHIPDEKKALKELYRVLKSGGDLFILSLMDPHSAKTLEDRTIKTTKEKLNAYGESDLERLYGTDFLERIKTDDVEIERIDYREHFSSTERTKMSLGNGEREIIYKITKR